VTLYYEQWTRLLEAVPELKPSSREQSRRQAQTKGILGCPIDFMPAHRLQTSVAQQGRVEISSPAGGRGCGNCRLFAQVNDEHGIHR
jgi:hypothetical protein